MASRSQTKPEISPKIGAKSKASTIQLQPYITLPYLSKKSGTSVDVKVDVKNVTEGRGMEGTRLGFLLGYMKKIQIMLNKTARMILNAGRMSRTTQLMRDCNWLYAKEIVKYHSLVNLWRTIRNGTPDYFNDKFTLNDDDDTVETTQARLMITSQSYRWRTARDWNSLPDTLKMCMSICVFKKHLRKHIMESRTPDDHG